MFILENLPWNCSNNSCLKFARNAQKYCLWIPISLTPSLTFHQHRQVWQPFLVSFDTNYFYLPSIYSILSIESCLMAKWLPVNTTLLLDEYSGLLLSSLPFSKFEQHFFPCLHLLALFYLTQLNSASCSWRCLIFCCCSSITPAFDGSNWTLLNGAPAKCEDPLDDDVCMDVSEYSMIEVEGIL